jgi:hypothetical protein
MQWSVLIVDSSSSVLTIHVCLQKMCKYTNVKAAVLSSCIQMAGYSAEMEVVVGGGCAGSHISVGIMDEFSRAQDKQ